MNRFFKFFWIISILLFFGALLLVYAFLPDRVGIHANAGGMPDEFIKREIFFYTCLITFIVTNALLYLLYKLLMATRRSAPSERALSLRQDLAGWMLGFAATLNFFYILVMFFFSSLNNAEALSDGHFALLVYTGPLFLALIFGLLVYILMRRRA